MRENVHFGVPDLKEDGGDRYQDDESGHEYKTVHNVVRELWSPFPGPGNGVVVSHLQDHEHNAGHEGVHDPGEANSSGVTHDPAEQDAHSRDTEGHSQQDDENHCDEGPVRVVQGQPPRVLPDRDHEIILSEKDQQHEEPAQVVLDEMGGRSRVVHVVGKEHALNRRLREVQIDILHRERRRDYRQDQELDGHQEDWGNDKEGVENSLNLFRFLLEGGIGDGVGVMKFRED